MKRSVKMMMVALVVVIFSCVVAFLKTKPHHDHVKQFELKCAEEPFVSMKMPPLDVDATVACAPGDIVAGRNAIVVRVVDGRNVVCYFAILNDGPHGEYRSVLKNLPLKWNAEYGVGEIVDSTSYEPVPDVFFDAGRFDRVVDPRCAIGDLIKILEFGRGMNGRRPDFAIEVLKKGIAEAN